jgi:hypothetical protein
MSSTLPRRVAQAALLAAAGAAPLIGASAAQAAELPLPATDGVTGLSQPDLSLPTGAADRVGQNLADSVLTPAMWGLGPSLPVAGYSADQAVNGSMPAADAALTQGTQHYIETHAADTLAGVTTPLREVPQLF